MESSIGRRVAHIRKAKGLSQQQLADKLGYSLSWVKKIESSARLLDRYSIIADVAGALGVHVSELTDEPVRVRDAHDAHEGVREVRRLLLVPAAETGPTRSVDALVRDVRAAIATRQAGRFAAFGRLVPDLLRETEGAIRTSTGADRDRAAGALVELLHGTAMLLRRLGYIDLAWIALDRAGAILSDVADPLLPVVQDWQVAETLFRAGQVDEALRTVDHGLSILARQGGNRPAVHSMYGTLHLLHAIGAAQHKDASRAAEGLAEARSAAHRTGVGRDDYQTVFGPAEVAIAGIATSVEMGETGAALNHASGVRPAEVRTVERRARYQIDLARAHAQATDVRSAYHAVTQAHRDAPEYVRNHVMAREVVAWLIDRERRASMTGLRTLAKRMGVA